MIWPNASLPRIDIDNLRTHLFQDSINAASTDPGKRPEASNPATRDQYTRASQPVPFSGPHQDPPVNVAEPGIAEASRATQDAASFVSSLPSTVPETMDALLMDDIIETAKLEAETEDREAHAQDTQYSNATQPISQTAFDDVIRSRSEQHSSHPDPAPQETQNHNEASDEEADEDLQDSIQEGDSNFVDICSSYAPAPETMDFVPVNFSPTQTQHEYTQFRESQRFKTPAVSGRKRDRAGNFTDTPIESRNPFARNGGATPGNVVGLSQAFANTQAASSPFPIVPTSELRSDKPSPGIAVERNVTGLPTSSPLRPLGDPWKPAEPASRYVPAGQSQALRQAMVSEAEDNRNTQESTTDEFDSIMSIVERQRRTKERDARARREFEAASSPISPRKHDPIKAPLPSRRAQSERPSRNRASSESRSMPSSPPALETEETAEHAVVSETIEEIVALELISEGVPSVATSFTRPKIKGHVTTLVPDTTKRKTRSTVEPKIDVQPSPSEHRARYGRIVNLEPVSSNPIRVANSQRSGLSTQEADNRIVASSAESVEVIPASPEGQLQSTEPSGLPQPTPAQDLQDDPMDGVDVDDDEIAITAPTHSGLNGVTSSNVPERSSGLPTQNKQSKSPYHTTFSSQQVGTNATTADWSSQPVRTTPPGRKRRRLDEMSQEHAFPVASQSSAFDPAEVLALDTDPDVARILCSPHDPDPIPSRKRVRLDPPLLVEQVESLEPMTHGAANSANMGRQLRGKNVVMDEDDDTTINVPPSSSALSELPSTPNTFKKTPFGALPPRKSIWSPVNSPQSRIASVSSIARTQPIRAGLQEVAAGRNRRVVSKTTLRTPKPKTSPLPPIKDTSPDPIAISTTTTEPGTPLPTTSEVVAPHMIYAYFMQGNARAYYPATCHGYSNETQEYTIEWPGYDPELMPKHKICSLDLRIGDEVRVDRKDWPKAGIWKIHDFGPVDGKEGDTGAIRDIYGHSTCILRPKGSRAIMPRGMGKDDPVPLDSIYLGSTHFDRLNKRPFRYSLAHGPISSIVNARPSTPQVRTSIPSTPSSRSRHSVRDVSVRPCSRQGIFSSMVFALSFNDTGTRDKITNLVHDHGGVILPLTFQDLMTEDMQVKSRYRDFSFAALLTNQFSRKVKYIEALALGLPCISGRWVEVSVKRQRLVEWQDYLLPAGESTELNGAVRSRILAPIDMTSSRLPEIIDRRSQSLASATVVFLTGRGKGEEKRKPYLFFVRTMGTISVESVPDLSTAKSYLEGIEKKGDIWVVVDDKDLKNARSMVAGLKSSTLGKKKAKGREDFDWQLRVADCQYVMQSLILGRLCETDDE